MTDMLMTDMLENTARLPAALERGGSLVYRSGAAAERESVVGAYSANLPLHRPMTRSRV
jgi:hypothetical protein